MTRLSQTLTNEFPRRLIWWMECDGCRTVGSDPKWRCTDLPLEEFREKGWACDRIDLCPACLAKGLKEVTPDPEFPGRSTLYRPEPNGTKP